MVNFLSVLSKTRTGIRYPSCVVLFFFVTTFFFNMGLPDRSRAESSPQLPPDVESGLTHLIALCSSAKNAPDPDFKKISPVAGFISQVPDMAAYTPEERGNTKGSFVAFTIKRPLPEIIRYAYNRQIPEGAINPSSINYAYWKELPKSGQVLPDVWKSLDRVSQPLVARGVMRESISPDVHTGAYYEYDLQRAFLIYHLGTKRVVVSLSNQLGDSEVGRKGYIVGQDQDWNYLYTQDQGLDRTGLGWVKSRIYSFTSVCIYIEDEARPGSVKIGVFQWLAAGWIGINLVDSHHIHTGLLRYAEQFKSMMESDRMPEPKTLEHVYTVLKNTQECLLRQKALDVTRYIKRKAEQDDALKGKTAIRRLSASAYVAQLDKERLISMLMREFIKYSLGKGTPLNPGFWLALKDGITPKG
jgi:hypothetical protein